MERKSNIELLRIIAFLMVVFIHVTPTGLMITNGIVSHSYSWYYTTIVRCIVNPAVTIYIIISGYVTYFNRNKYNIKKQLKRILIPIIGLTPILFCINIFENGINIKTLKEFINMVVMLNGTFYHMWYIVGYIFIILIAKMLIKGIETYSQRQYTRLLISMYILIGVTELYTLLTDRIVFVGMFNNNLIFFIVMFLTGYYINKYNIKIDKRISATMIIIIEYINYTIFLKYNPINSPLKLMTIANNFQIFNILQSIFIFLFFKEMKIKKSKIINYIAKLTYGAYIVHVFYIYFNQKYFPFLRYINNNDYFIYDISFVIIVAMCSILTESIR